MVALVFGALASRMPLAGYIFRDSSFKLPWEYLGVMVAIGLVYYVYMLIRGKSLTMPRQLVEPQEVAEIHAQGDERPA
jgi:hypothetical protein